LLGEVVWSTTEGEDPGMGIQFIYSDQVQQQEFEAVVEKLMSESLGPQLAQKLLNKPLAKP
jgi:type IV pilus assembly protein PilZ